MFVLKGEILSECLAVSKDVYDLRGLRSFRYKVVSIQVVSIQIKVVSIQIKSRFDTNQKSFRYKSKVVSIQPPFT